MSPERWRHLKEILDRALELPPGEQEAWLARASAGDEELRHRAETLLAGRVPSADFLETPAVRLVPRRPETPGPGERVGPYRLVGPIGRGGMGVVHLAVREQGFTKKVAIKLLERGRHTAGIVRRFERERQILAQLEHPGIARLLDGGSTEGGLPYFVMEHVEGEPIDLYCAHRGLSIRERLGIFGRVCSAVAFAHRHLVVHSDLKPGNILVTSEGDPKLLDFGIARLIGRRGPAMEESESEKRPWSMTPSYASPEQVRGEALTTASDVFSLGVLLHELLTGQRPRACRAGDRRLRGDLDRIVAKALAANPAERYSSVEQLADDVGRHLRGLPVRVRSGEPGYRAGRFVRRHWRPLGAAAFFFLLVLGFGLHARRQAGELEVALDVTRQSAAILGTVFEASNPYDDGGPSPRELLDRGFAEILPQLGTRPEIKAELLESLALAYGGLGGYEKAAGLHREALGLREAHLEPASPEVARSLVNLSSALQRLERYEEAEPYLRRGLALLVERYGEGHPEVFGSRHNLAVLLGRLGRTAEAEALYRRVLESKTEYHGEEHPEVAREMCNLASLLTRNGKLGEAEVLFREALRIQERELGESHPRVAKALSGQGEMFHRAGRPEEAEESLSRALGIQERVLPASHPDLALTHHRLASVLKDQARIHEAERHQAEAVRQARQSLPEGHPDLGRFLIGLAEVLVREERFAEAEPFYREGVSILRQATNENETFLAQVLDKWGLVLKRLGRLEEAEVPLREGLEIRRRHSAPARSLAASLTNLASLLAARGSFAEAEALAREAIEVPTTSRTPSWRLAEAHGVLGACLVEQKRFEEAEKLLLESHGVLERERGSCEPRTLEALERLARLYEAWGRPEKQVSPDCHPENGAEPVADADVRGVVIDYVGDGSALENAGLRSGDVVVSWQRLPNPPANPGGARGEIRSVFDWSRLMMEQAPRGTIVLTGEREGLPRSFHVATGLWWDTTVRPRLPAGVRADYSKMRELMESGEVGEWSPLWEKTDRKLWAALASHVGDLWAEKGQWEPARAAYGKALEHAPDPMARAVVQDSLGELYLGQGLLDRSESHYRSALEIREKLVPESLLVASSWNNLGAVEAFRWYLKRSAQYNERALALQQKLAPDGLDVAATLHNLGTVAGDRGDLDLAAGYHRRALRIWEKIARPENLNVVATLNELGRVARIRGELKLAEAYYDRALGIAEQLAPESFYHGWCRLNLGQVASLRKELELAEENYGQALEIFEKLGPDSHRVAAVLVNSGEVARARGDLPLAERRLLRALEILEKRAPRSVDLSNSLTNLARLAETRGEPDLAADYHERSLEIREKLAPGSQKVAENLNALGKLARTRGDWDRAEAFFERSLEALDSQVEKLGGSQDVKGGFRAGYGRYYQDLVELLLERRRPAEAFSVLERSRAGSFLALLAERDLGVARDLPEELAEERRSLRARYDRALRRLEALSGEDIAEETEILHHELSLLRSESEELLGRIRNVSPGFTAVHHPQPLSWEAARGSLDPGTAMLSYSVEEEKTRLFVLQAGKELRVETVPRGEDELLEEVERLREAMSADGRQQEVRETGRNLYQALIEPAEEDLAAADRILVVADGPLHFLPFAALNRGTVESPVYLVEWKPVASVLSATVHAELKKSRPERGSLGQRPLQLAAFGDPVYPREAELSEPGRIRDVRLSSALERGYFPGWGELPLTRREVEGIAELFAPGRFELFLAEEATEEAVKALDRREPAIVHFATHGYVDERSPLDSALVLSLPEGLPEGRDNGLLQVWEILESVRFDADLVVLSACRTGTGELRGGEGLIGLTRAFQIAGARSVLATLWDVADDATAELMIRFYRHLVSGLAKDRALREAQLELLRGPIEVTTEDGRRVERDFSAPYFWAGFELVGDWR